MPWRMKVHRADEAGATSAHIYGHGDRRTGIPLDPLEWGATYRSLKPYRFEGEPREAYAELNGYRDPPPCAVEGTGGATLFCDRVKQIIEELEPGRHQFLPVKLHQFKQGHRPGSGEPFAEPYWVLNAYDRPDALDYEQSKGRLVSNSLWQGPLGDHHDDFAVKGAAIVGRHIWRNASPCSPRYLFASDEIKQRFVAQKFKSAAFYRMRVV